MIGTVLTLGTDVKIIVLSGLIIGTIIIGYLLSSFLAGAGYEPVPRKRLELMIEFSRPDEKTRVFDLGSGFGKIIIAISQRFHSRCTGVEIDPLKVWWTRGAIRRKKLDKYADVVRANLLDVDLSSADIVYVFLWTGIMQKLREKVLVQMKPGSLVVSYFHEFDGWEPERKDASAKVYIYRIPSRTA
ncbi:MAG: 50S ribosomal protein L11 methyltransferase [Thaumarchaeota archaeon]|nr:50S ribosomal protein L11 methyltransferase [Nitrososphaerota archaeon]